MKRFPAAAITMMALAVPAHALGQNQGPPSGSIVGSPPGAAGAQRPGPPPRDNAPTTPTGTARIRGRVVAADSSAPLRRAQVSINAAEFTLRRTATTDAEGRYEFAELPAGRYSIFFAKGGYVGLQFGQRRPFEGGTPVILTDGQTIANANVALPRGAVISGRLTDELGEPIAGAQVQVQRYQYGIDGVRRLQFAGNEDTSDDLGQFRLYGLMPGEYVVSAGTRGISIMAPGFTGNDSNEGYVPTFYPGTLNVNEAQPVTVAVGQETPIQFSLQIARMNRVAGIVVDSSGRPVSGAMILLRSGSPGSIIRGVGGGQTGTDGTFVMSNIAPGDYSIDVRPNPRLGVEPEFGTVPVTVAGADITGLRIVTGKGSMVSGRVVFEGQSPRGGPNPLRVFAQQADPARAGALFFATDPASNGTVADDGTFQISGVSGEVLFRAATPSGWTLKSVLLEGKDITDEPVDVMHGQTVEGLRVVLTDRLTDVSGQVTDGRGQAKDYVVVIQPDGEAQGPIPSRFLRTTRPDQDGRFRVRGMPPGRYVATAVESLEQGRHFVPEVQRELREKGRSFSVAEGASVVVDLKLTSGF